MLARETLVHVHVDVSVTRHTEDHPYRAHLVREEEDGGKGEILR